ncbi:MerR family mercuric resistance operon transcriptional regulator [Novosphingobium kunmingense]|uniref:MerR family mercuric resistance operon transcriptional regulator n=1 Tax=Novosphingobium kunmingense TaxID=1211806 RepID=A0A2N0H7L7_9SPHN|nr:MerR family transcriptional regulator [Novosphingobium kunmingense]PKB14942.1 MerR family mercuric resistance operon transcriptional regulator [Novosphingobium kunmingense]
MALPAIAIGTLSRICECNIETIRYYERIALMPRAERRGRYRTYAEPDIARLRFIKRARGLGFSIEEIRSLLDLSRSDPAASTQSCSDARQIAATNLLSVRARLDDLKRIEAALSASIAACDRDEFTGCPLLDALTGTEIEL